MLFSKLYKIIVNKASFVRFMGDDRVNLPSLDLPLVSYASKSLF